MNYLAHLYLSCNNNELLIGNFLADFVSIRYAHTLPPAIGKGILLHRKIDHFTDNHPLVKEGIGRLRNTHGKYAPVVIDIFYDYFLSNNWNHFHASSLQSFASLTYQTLQQYTQYMPNPLQVQLNQMIASNWLTQYGAYQGMHHTFERLKKRVSQPQYLNGVLDSLSQEEPVMQQEFMLFFPEVVEFVATECGC